MVGQISHDLRTPLNGIVINLNLAIDNISTKPDGVKEDYLKPALMNCN
jgi:signal transduction histidine kinase